MIMIIDHFTTVSQMKLIDSSRVTHDLPCGNESEMSIPKIVKMLEHCTRKSQKK